jgi:hypothetical protein
MACQPGNIVRWRTAPGTPTAAPNCAKKTNQPRANPIKKPTHQPCSNEINRYIWEPERSLKQPAHCKLKTANNLKKL